MSVEDAMQIAAIFEADDVIAVPAKACRVLASEIRNLTNQIVDLKLKLKEVSND